MNTPSQVRSAGRQLMVHSVLSILVAMIGIALLVYMIRVEDEMGALPLALITLGVGWFIIARVRLRPRQARSAASP